MSRPALGGTSRRHRAWWLLLVPAVAVPIVEVWLLIAVGRWLGVLPTLAILVVQAAFGVVLVRRAAHRASAALPGAVAEGLSPASGLLAAGSAALGGLLLALPGFVTDVLALGCLLPVTRRWAAGVLARVVDRRMSRLVPAMAVRWSPAGTPFEVIRGETVDDAPSPTAGDHPRVITGEVDGSVR